MIAPRKLFLVDGIGALISAFSLGVLLPYFQSHIGMPGHLLYGLAVLSTLFSLYSISSYLNFGLRWRAFMKGIAIINLSYCVLSFCLVYYFFEALSIYGLAYFIGEKLIVAVLVVIEWKTATSSDAAPATKNNL